jgi:DNA-binding transcriptional ArsR family regulator
MLYLSIAHIALAMKNGVEVISEPARAKVLVNPMRREIVRLLSDRPMTESELAKRLDLSDPSVCHHLKILGDSGFVRIARKEIESHGIIQKFYETNALAYFIDTEEMPVGVVRYFMPISLERARGILAALNVVTDRYEHVSMVELEVFAKTLASTIAQIASRYSGRQSEDGEQLIGRIYRDAISYMTDKADVLPGKASSPLLHVRRSLGKKQTTSAKT